MHGQQNIKLVPIRADSHIPCRSLAVLKANSHIPCRSLAVLKANSHIPCRSLAATLPLPCHSPHSRLRAISGRPMLIHTYHAVPMSFPCRDSAVALRGRFQNGIFVAWRGNGMACVNQTRPHCVNQMGKTQSKPLAERHGMCGSNTAALCTSNGKDTV
jgi:hypothetical protein